MLTKVLGGSTVVLLLVCASAFIKIAWLESDITILETNVENLENGLKEQKLTNKTFEDLMVASVQREEDLKSQLQTIRTDNTNLSNEINNLRMTENARALLQPFERGEAARNRLGVSWMRFEGRDSINSSSSQVSTTNN